MISTLGRAGLRPVVIGLAALTVGIFVEWPKRLSGSAEPSAPAFERGAFISVPKRSFALASLAPSLPAAPVARESADAAGSHRPSTFAERFSAVFWFHEDDEETGSVTRETVEPAAVEVDLDEAPPPPRVNDGKRTAVYVITEHVVYMPNGTRLEAHSGLGSRADDPRYINGRNRGPTPPNVYDLVMRERRFHGVRAIRLIPVDESRMFGRDGMLAHKYMRGGKAQSAGCVVFRDYPAFLNAFLRGEVDRLVVVERVEDAPETPRNIGHANLSHHAKRKRVASR
jgi:Protein of unknown function (DUF2778)